LLWHERPGLNRSVAGRDGTVSVSNLRFETGHLGAAASEVIQKEDISLMRVFEVLFIIAPNIEESDIETLVTQMSDVATNQGARIVKVDRMGRRKLAYNIGKFYEGHYVVLTIEGTGSEIAEIERRMRVTDAVIRYITIRIDEDLKRAEKFRARRALRAAASATTRRGRRAEPVLPIGNAEEEDEGEDAE
jgi:small subunit ribosomal protein S6